VAASEPLKLDVVEQAYHVLRPGGVVLVASDCENDQLFPPVLKKVFGRVHHPPTEGTLLWCERPEGPAGAPTARDDVSGKAHGVSMRFLTRPGTFSYGSFDDGAAGACRDDDDQPR
jgi:16S rRNA G1207 methylase RsmC